MAHIIIDAKNIKFNLNSCFDEYGRVFEYNNQFCRGIYDNSVSVVEDYFKSGLIDRLMEEKLIPKTEVSSYCSELFPLILVHEKINPVLYPSEWTFDMLKKASLMTLKLMDIMLDYGYVLKDAHYWNIIFKDNEPVWCDITSFEKADKIAYHVFLEYITHQFQLLELFSLSPDLGRERLVRRMDYGLSYNLFYKYGFRNQSYARTRAEKSRRILKKIAASGNKRYYKKFISVFTKKIKKFTVRGQSQWGNYQTDFRDSNNNIIPNEGNCRLLTIGDLLKKYKFTTSLELGGNQGVFSQILLESQQVEKAFCSDYDEIAINTLYRTISDDNAVHKFAGMTAMFYDFMNEAYDEYNVTCLAKRIKCDLLIALAMTHHLILSQHLNIDVMFERFANMTSRYLAVEFMPLGLWDGEKSVSVILPDWYSVDTFKECMNKQFRILENHVLEKNRILFIGEKI